MINPEQLSALDLLVWLRTGRLAGARLGISQCSISRRAASCCDLFSLRLKRLQGEWQVVGDTALLALERQVHQRLRLLGRWPLRLECTAWEVTALAMPLPAGWVAGRFDHLRNRPLELLRDRVIDAWISSFAAADLPSERDPELISFPMARLPVWLMAEAHHPLARVPHLSRGDLDRYPSLGLPPDEAPALHRELSRQGLGTESIRSHRYCPEDWEGRTADGVTMSLGTPISSRFCPQLVRLDWELGFETGLSLVVRRDLAEQEAIQRLLQLLLKRASTALATCRL